MSDTTIQFCDMLASLSLEGNAYKHIVSYGQQVMKDELLRSNEVRDQLYSLGVKTLSFSLDLSDQDRSLLKPLLSRFVLDILGNDGVTRHHPYGSVYAIKLINPCVWWKVAKRIWRGDGVKSFNEFTIKADYITVYMNYEYIKDATPFVVCSINWCSNLAGKLHPIGIADLNSNSLFPSNYHCISRAIDIRDKYEHALFVGWVISKIKSIKMFEEASLNSTKEQVEKYKAYNQEQIQRLIDLVMKCDCETDRH